MSDRCPRCGLADAWDGNTCGHCQPRKEGPPGPGLGVVALRGSLLLGALAALIASGLDVASILVSSGQEGETVTLADGLGMAVVLPELLVLGVFVRIAETMGPERLASLRRSSICTYASGWLMVVASVLLALIPEGGSGWILGLALAVSVALALLFVFATQTKAVLVVFLLLYLAVRVLGAWVLGRWLEPGMGTGVVAAVLLVASYIGYSIWFAISLLKARDLLGRMAVLRGAVELLGGVALVGVLVWLGVAMGTAPEEVVADEQAMDQLWAAKWQQVAAVPLVISVAVGLCTVLLFWDIHRRLAGGSPSAG